MRTCSCPHEATRHGFLRTGYDALCPFHGKPVPEPVAPAARPAPVVAVPICGDCESRHASDVRCDFVDEN